MRTVTSVPLVRTALPELRALPVSLVLSARWGRRVRRATLAPLVSPARPGLLVLSAPLVPPVPLVLLARAVRQAIDGSTIITVAADTVSGSKTFTVNCPAGKFALSGGYDIQGSVTASYRSDAAGDPTGTTSWTITQTSGNSGSGKAYVYCA